MGFRGSLIPRFNHSSGGAVCVGETMLPGLIDWVLSSDFSSSIISLNGEIFTLTIKIMKVNFK